MKIGLCPRGYLELSWEERKLLNELRERDRKVRQHEMAHIAAGGQYVISGPRYKFVKGPDGRMYAVGGEVKIDTSPVPGDPEATIRKMEQVYRAALAPADPSPQDRMVAAEAKRKEMEARMEMRKEGNFNVIV